MDLPLLLAGPILRRVEPTLASVWVALREEATVRLLVWEGRVAAEGAGPPFLTSSDAGESTWRIGAKLHLGLISVRIPPASGRSFQPDRLYSYDLEITIGTRKETLSSLHMLSGETVDGIAHVPLGYEDGLLPSFAPPPSELEDLRILYGSCRLPSHGDPDAMVWIDDLILQGDLAADPRRRPHQLFLGGDQIYADDAKALHMLTVMELGQELIGRTPGPSGTPVPVEQIHLDGVLPRNTTAENQAAPREAYGPDTAAAPGDLPADRAHFPEGRRLDLTKRGAQFTSGDGSSHLISVGEFAAMYLTVWSNACWGAQIPGAFLLTDASDPGTRRPLTWTDEPGPTSAIELPALEFPPSVPLHLHQPAKPDTRTPEQKQKDEAKRQKSLRASHGIHRAFMQGLPKVQRALANIPTYMMFDDHDVTDDWFLNPTWRDRVLTTSLGQVILRNAMLTYALFQDWGNDPLRYDSGERAELLTRATELFPAAAVTGPVEAPAARLAVLFGHDLRNTENPDGTYASVRPPILWHFSVDGPKHRVIALDNRTRRSYVGRLGPPGNISMEAQADQIPKPPLPAGREVLILVAPLQVIGPPVLDDVVAPLVYRVFDLLKASNNSDLSKSSLTGLRQMTGTDPDAIEAWAFDAPTFEHLLTRLAPYQRVVLLSGDVHNSSGSLMSYWPKDAVRPARFAQFTSSGFKNVMPQKIAAVDRAVGFAQQMIRANLGTERIGWDRPEENLVLLPGGMTELDLVPVMRSRLQSVPVMIPTWGWPRIEDDPDTPEDETVVSRLNPDLPPDWRWRVKPLLDLRPDAERPEPIRPIELDHARIDADLESTDTLIDAYQAIASRHQHALGHLRNARQIMFRSNFGLLRFEPLEDGRLDAIHEVHTAFTDPDQPTTEPPRPQPYLFQRAALGPDDEDPPAELRTKVIEARPVPLVPL